MARSTARPHTDAQASTVPVASGLFPDRVQPRMIRCHVPAASLGVLSSFEFPLSSPSPIKQSGWKRENGQPDPVAPVTPSWRLQGKPGEGEPCVSSGVGVGAGAGAGAGAGVVEVGRAWASASPWERARVSASLERRNRGVGVAGGQVGQMGLRADPGSPEKAEHDKEQGHRCALRHYATPEEQNVTVAPSPAFAGKRLVIEARRRQQCGLSSVTNQRSPST